LPLLKIKCRQGPKCDGGIFEFLKKKMLPRIQNLSAKPKTIIIFFFFSLSLGYSRAAAMKEIFLKDFFFGGKKKKTSSSFFNHTREGTQLSFLLGGKEKEKKKIFG
jgi:hypothetical protein